VLNDFLDSLFSFFTETATRQKRIAVNYLFPLNISLFPGAPGSFSTTNPAFCNIRLTAPFAQYVVRTASRLQIEKMASKIACDHISGCLSGAKASK
jgi:hypothetical protein